MSLPLSRPPQRGRLVDPLTGNPSREFAAHLRDMHAQVDALRTGQTIEDADGTLADLTTKFNTLLAALRTSGVLVL